jgi:hypothetical protein
VNNFDYGPLKVESETKISRNEIGWYPSRKGIASICFI